MMWRIQRVLKRTRALPVYGRYFLLRARWISDVLCRAVTGSGFSKRMLYTDDDDCIYQFKRCVGFNGINIAATKPDILERGLSLHLKRIPENKRRKLRQLWNMYRMIKPQLLGFIFDILVRVLNRLKEVHLSKLYCLT